MVDAGHLLLTPLFLLSLPLVLLDLTLAGASDELFIWAKERGGKVSEVVQGHEGQ